MIRQFNQSLCFHISLALSVIMSLPVLFANAAFVQAQETQIEALPAELAEEVQTEAFPAEPVEESVAAYEETANVDAGIALYEEAYASDSDAKTYEGFIYEVTEENTVTIAGYEGSNTGLMIPAEIAGYPITGIGKGAFFYCSSLTSVTIPESVTVVGENAFADSPNVAIACFEGFAAYAYAVSNGISYRLLSKPAADVVYSDLDGNSDITAADALNVLQIVVKLKVPTAQQEKAADVNGDNSVSAADALLILQKVVKLINSFTAEKAAL